MQERNGGVLRDADSEVMMQTAGAEKGRLDSAAHPVTASLSSRCRLLVAPPPLPLLPLPQRPWLSWHS